MAVILILLSLVGLAPAEPDRVEALDSPPSEVEVECYVRCAQYCLFDPAWLGWE